MHTPSSIGPLSPPGHPLSPTPSLFSNNSTGSSSKKSQRRRSSSNRRSLSSGSKLQCSVCLESLDLRAFARPQRMKEHASTCRSCVWKALAQNHLSDSSPGIDSSSSSLSSYSEGPTWNTCVSSPLRRQNTVESVQDVPEEALEASSVGTLEV